MTEIGPINIQLTASGISDVMREFKTLEDRATALERRLTALSQEGSKRRVKTSKDEQKAKADTRSQEVKDAEAAEKKKTADAETWAKARERIVNNSAMMAGRYAKQQADIEIREAQRSLAARERISKQLSRGILSDLRSTLGSAARLVSIGLGMAGGLSVAGAFGHEMAISKSAAQLSNASALPGKPGSRIPTAQIIAQARSIGKEFTVDTEDVIGVQKSILDFTGNPQLMTDLSRDVVKYATAEGMEDKLQDMGTLAGTLAAQNPKATRDQLRAMMRIATAQGKTGPIEVADMAKFLPVATSVAPEFAGSQEDNQVRLMARLQTSRLGGASAEEAATAVKNLPRDILRHQKAFNALGINVMDPSGKGLKNINALEAEALNATKGDIGKLNKLFGPRTMANIITDLPDYQRAEALKKGSGGQAVFEKQENILKQKLTEAEIDADLANRRQSDENKVHDAMLKLETAIATELVPHLIPLVTQLGEMAPAIGSALKGLGDLITWATKHPWEAAFATLGIMVTKAIIAKVGEMVVADITAAITARILGTTAATTATGAIAGGAAMGVALAGPPIAFGLAVKQGVDNANAAEAADEKAGSDRAAAESADELKANLDAAKKQLETLNREKAFHITGSGMGYADPAIDRANYERESKARQLESYVKAAEQRLLDTETAKKLNEAATNLNNAAVNLGGGAGGAGGGTSGGAGPRSTSGAGFVSGHGATSDF
jgi:hypothetical protein